MKFKSLFLIVAAFAWTPIVGAVSTESVSEASIPSTETISSILPAVDSSSASFVHSKPVRAIHVTAWLAGSKKYRAKLQEVFKTTVINSVVIDIKEFEGEVYIPGVKMAEKHGAYVSAMPDIATWISELKSQGIYTVARIVVFKDNIMPRKVPSMAVKNSNGDLWFDRSRITWLDPYNQDAWRYNLLIALEASKLGFDEVQFDYIRFPTDGALHQMRFSSRYDKSTGSSALVSFLKQARQLLEPSGTKISIDVFGLTTSVNTGMGIGQLISPMTEQVHFVCPMVYPSHYAKGEYGIPNPNDEPYKTIAYAMRDALKTLGPGQGHKLRPYFQDFSLKGRGIRYGKKEIRAQMQAAADLGIENWTLWNARCSYTLDAIKTPIIPVISNKDVNLSTDTKHNPIRR